MVSYLEISMEIRQFLLLYAFIRLVIRGFYSKSRSNPCPIGSVGRKQFWVHFICPKTFPAAFLKSHECVPELKNTEALVSKCSKLSVPSKWNRVLNRPYELLYKLCDHRVTTWSYLKLVEEINKFRSWPAVHFAQHDEGFRNCLDS